MERKQEYGEGWEHAKYQQCLITVRLTTKKRDRDLKNRKQNAL